MGPKAFKPPAQASSGASRWDASRAAWAGGGRGPGGPPGGYEPLGTPSPTRRARHGWRILLGCLIVLLASAGTSAVAVLEQVHTLVQDISVNKPLKVSSTALAAPHFGQPETLLLVGDDTRKVFKYYNGYVPDLANEMLLVRIDPGKPWISMMSLPRELWVNITEPDGVTYTNRLNSAYTFGTTTLLRTIKQVTGLSVNHVIVTTFTQFENAINKLGCVYDTIDERYFHNNALGGAQYQNIDLLPGYQCLNGSQAEQFVSYRHTDTSQVRDARDQSFLLAVKQQYGPRLAGNVGEFERVFGETVQTDAGLRSPTEILNLANLLISAASLHVRQVHFQTTPCSSTCPYGDLTASPQQIQASVHKFLFGRDTTPNQQVAAIGRRIHRRNGLVSLPLTATLAANVAGERAAAARLRFTAEFPKVQDLAGTVFPVAPQCTDVVQACVRDYLIHAPGGRSYPIYVEVFSNGQLGQFYDVQGTTWTGAPLLADPNQTIHVGGRTYELYYDGSHLQTIAWRQYGAVYWVHNSLSDAVGNGELLAIAEQTVPIGPVRSGPASRTRTRVVLRASSVPTYRAPAVRTPLIESVGRVGSLVTLALVPLGLLVALLQRGRLRSLRDQMDAAARTAAVLEAHVAAATSGRPPTFAHGAAGYAAAPPAGEPLSDSVRVSFKRHRARRPLVGVGVALALVFAAAAVGLGLNSALGHNRTRPLTPTAAVAVLDAGRGTAAAHRLAVRLARRHVDVVAVGSLRSARPASYEILYRRGDAGQAQLLTGILGVRRPLVEPIDPITAKEIGSAPRLVVVIP